MALRMKTGCGQEQGSPGGHARTVGKAARLSHGPQVGHQVECRPMAYGHRIDIGNRHGKSGALQQRTGVADIHEGQYAGMDAATHRSFRRDQAFAQFAKRPRPGCTSQEQAIGRKRQPVLDQQSRDVVGLVKMMQRNGKIVAAWLRREGFAVPTRVDGNLPDTAARAKPLRHLAGMGARAQTTLETTRRRVKPVFELVHGPVQQEVGSRLAHGAGTRKIGCGTACVEKWRCSAHGLVRPARGSVMGSVMQRLPTAGLREILGGASRSVKAFLFPDSCLACRRHVGSHGSLCPSCWSKVRFIAEPLCPVTGAPFAHDFGTGMVSAEAMANPPVYDRARAACVHAGIARQLASNLKYADRTELAPWMARWMLRAGARMVAESDIVVPVPLHRMRFWTRRYNQSAELARALAAEAGLPFEPGALVRHRSTRPQVGLNPRQRAVNVRNVFAVPPEREIMVSGRRILLVDDVLTTGATVNAAARALKRAGASHVGVLTFSRVVPGTHD